MSPPRRFPARNAVRSAARVAGAVAIACAAAWCAGLVYFTGPGGQDARVAGAFVPVILGLGAIVTLFDRRWARSGVLAFAVMFGVLLAWWSTITPSNDREWRPEVAVLPHATIAGDLVTVYGIRNFEYRSEDDFTPRYEERTYDLRKLDSVDLVSAYWMGPAIAHLFVTFGFGDEHLAVSIEARKERTEAYTTLGGFFRQYELVYVVGDERDLVRLRTNYRKDPPEDVYLMRLKAPVEQARRFFLDYVEAINSLHAHPKFYNTLLTNCTTAILVHARSNPASLGYSWKVLASGYAPEYVYDAGRTDKSLPYREFMRRSRINDAARAADAAPDFSRRIRAGLPGMDAR
jgi:Domain of unknown function (DUF4105)